MMEGWAAIAAGAAVVPACWWLTVTMAVGFYHSSATVTMWQNASFGILFLMWAVMMAAMMAARRFAVPETVLEVWLTPTNFTKYRKFTKLRKFANNYNRRRYFGAVSI